jgi:hypothetical protein
MRATFMLDIRNNTRGLFRLELASEVEFHAEPGVFNDFPLGIDWHFHSEYYVSLDGINIISKQSIICLSCEGDEEFQV